MTEYTIIYETLHGSRAYGLESESSDWDYKGILVGPAAWYLGFRGGPEQIETGPDRVLYDVRKFVRLAARANPTLIETLFTDESDHVVSTDAGQELLSHRRELLSRRVEGSFAGYAHSQLKRIRTHRRWLLTPPEGPPSRTGFGLPDKPTIPRDQLGALEALESSGDAPPLDSNYLSLLHRERAYRRAKAEWKQYQSWLAHRNPARARLEASFGYDTKHAQHLIRLLRMAVEILGSGEVRVRRPDREELLAIRGGVWTYEELMENADVLRDQVKHASEGSTLPDAPDEDRLDALCERVVSRVLAAT